MQPVTYPAAAEEHDAEKACLEEERGQHLVGHQRPDHRPGDVGEHRPVGAELIRHHDARNDAHGEGDGEDLEPVLEEPQIGLVPRPEKQPVHHRQIARQSDREGREEEMEGDGEGELEPRQKYRVETCELRHVPVPFGSLGPEARAESPSGERGRSARSVGRTMVKGCKLFFRQKRSGYDHRGPVAETAVRPCQQAARSEGLSPADWQGAHLPAAAQNLPWSAMQRFAANSARSRIGRTWVRRARTGREDRRLQTGLGEIARRMRSIAEGSGLRQIACFLDEGDPCVDFLGVSPRENPLPVPDVVAGDAQSQTAGGER